MGIFNFLKRKSYEDLIQESWLVEVGTIASKLESKQMGFRYGSAPARRALLAAECLNEEKQLAPILHGEPLTDAGRGAVIDLCIFQELSRLSIQTINARWSTELAFYEDRLSEELFESFSELCDYTLLLTQHYGKVCMKRRAAGMAHLDGADLLGSTALLGAMLRQHSDALKLFIKTNEECSWADNMKNCNFGMKLP